LLHLCDAVWRPQNGRPRLAAFCFAISSAALLLFLGQTPAAEWFVRHCDELSPPFLAITWTGSAAGLIALAVTRSGGPNRVFFCTVTVIALIGFALAWPWIGPCVQSPYGHLPPDTQDMIATRIMEARPITATIANDPITGLSYFGPALVVTLLATLRWAKRRRNPATTPPGVVYLVVIAWIGVIASFWQMRQIVILATVVPALTGYVVAPALIDRMARPTGATQMKLYGLALVTLFQPMLVVFGVQGYLRVASDQAVTGEVMGALQDAACTVPEKVAGLNVVPPGTLLTGTNLGPLLIMQTHHAALVAPYHRSNAALTNQRLLEVPDAGQFAAQLSALGGTGFVVCAGSFYGARDSVGTLAAKGEAPTGFAKVPLAVADVLLFVKDDLE